MLLFSEGVLFKLGDKLQYKTVLGTACIQITEKKSKFITYVSYIQNECDAIDFLDEIKSMHRDARHNVYAYSIGGQNPIQRHSDDGEPTGTGGIPVIEAIKAKGVEDVIVVVTRYFGGILLGKGGLSRTYAKAAAMGLDAIHVVNKVLCRQIIVETEYGQSGKLQGLISEQGFYIENTNYEHNVKMQILVAVDKIENFIRIVNDVTDGIADIKMYDSRYIITEPNGKIISFGH